MRFRIDPDAKAVVLPVCQQPAALKEKIVEKLQEMERMAALESINLQSG